MHEGKKVFAMYDPPHLIKSVRNNFKNHGFVIDGKDILWQHVKEFYDADSSKPIKMAPKLRKKHIHLPPFSPLRVRLATQVLSHSVASGMGVLAQWGIISSEAIYTSHFIEKMDVLFNCFNSKTLSSTAKMRHAFSETSGHKDQLKELKSWIQRIKTKGSREPPCLAGWQLAINALLMMWDILRDDFNFQFLLTNRLNQDCVENLFSIIRAKGAQRDNPDTSQFRAAFRQVMVDSVMVPAKGANCESDVDHFICSLENVKAGSTPDEQVQPETSLMDMIPWSVKSILSVCTVPTYERDEDLTKQENNILAYISGYIVRKLKGKICSPCANKIVGTLDPDHYAYQDFIAKKSYGKLIAPSNTLLGVVQLLELKYRKVIDSVVHEEGIKAKLVRELGKVQRLQSLSCESCHLQLLVVHMVVNIRLHHTIKEANHSLKENKDRKNRKTIKFSHL